MLSKPEALLSRRQCSRENCTNNATRKAEFVLLAACRHGANTGDVPSPAGSDQRPTGRRPAKGLPDVFVCTEHAIKVNPNELLHDEGKKMIEDAFESAGKAKPDWERSFAKWVQI